MLNGKTGGAGGNHILRNIDCKIQRGGGYAIQEFRIVLTSAHSPKSTNESLVKAKPLPGRRVHPSRYAKSKNHSE